MNAGYVRIPSTLSRFRFCHVGISQPPARLAQNTAVRTVERSTPLTHATTAQERAEPEMTALVARSITAPTTGWQIWATTKATERPAETRTPPRYSRINKGVATPTATKSE